jgi:hypothetical protein
MKREAKKLTDATIRSMTKPGLFADGDGLYIQISLSGTRSWIFRSMIAGRPGKLGIGKYPKINLAEARAKARKVRTLIDEGRNPFAEAAKVGQRANERTLLACADQAYGREAKKRREWQAVERRPYPPVDDDISSIAKRQSDIPRADAAA